MISGWKCTAGTVTIQIDSRPPTQAAYGTSRSDTASTCGDTNNGFGLLFNWNNLGDGRHTVRALDNGVQFAEASITVQTLGVPFVTGASGEVDVAKFPGATSGVTLAWSEALQNFSIVGTCGNAGQPECYRSLKICGENDRSCEALNVIGCVFAGDDADGSGGNIGFVDGTSNGTTLGPVAFIDFGFWQNAECGTSGTGWHAPAGSCETGQGSRLKRCRNVIAEQ